jgi:phosphate-selective porin O/P
VRKTFLAVLSLLTLPVVAGAQTPTTQKYGFSPEAFEIKYYIQPRWSWFSENKDVYDSNLGPGTDNGFSVRRSRLFLTSNVSPSIKGRLQVELKPEKFEANDVCFEWNPSVQEKRPYTFTVGQFKKPLSYQEFVMSSANLNLIDRPYTNDFLEKKVLASAEDQGVMGTADLWEYGVPILVNVGLFNGNGKDVKYDGNSGKQLVGRVQVTPLTGVSVGLNGEINRLGYASDTTEAKNFTVWGGDVVLARKGVQIVSEVFGGDNTSSLSSSGQIFPEVPTFLGWYAEAIYRARSGFEPAARVEVFDPDTDTDNDGRTILTGQLAYSFSPNFRWQIDVAHTTYQSSNLDALTGVYSQWTIRL